MKHSGFSLIELMIAVAIVAILTSVAYPSYQGYVARGVRSEAASVLLDAANRQEQYYLDFHIYTKDLTNLGYSASSFDHPTDRPTYKISVTAADVNGFVLKAKAINAQATRDSDCASLEINQLGERTSNGASTDTKECWP